MTLTQRRNSGPAKSLKLEEIAKLVGGELVGDPTTAITGVAGIKEAKKGDITFLANARYLSFLDETEASAVIASTQTAPGKKPLVRIANPSPAFSKIVSLFSKFKDPKTPGVHPTAVIDPTVKLGQDVFVGPHVVIEKETVIGGRSSIEANTFIGARCRLGEEAVIYPNVTIREDSQIGSRVIIHSGAVIGSDGFGYETVDGVHVKIPQTGFVLIEEDVEIGANVCIDRGRFQKTWIQKGSKIDNLVQIAHNVVIGPHCIVVSQAGISGSTTLGRNVVIAGQAGIVGHLEIGDEAVIGAQAGVSKSIPPKAVVLGSPAKPITEQKRIFVLIAKLPELFKDLAKIKKKLEK